jgi:hypothetical protein
MATNNNTPAMSEKPLHRGRGWGGSSSIKNREAFFDCLEEGLQSYFDGHDRFFGGIIHLTIGVRDGKVGGIIKSQEMLHYSGFTLDRVRSILAYVLPRFVPRTEVAMVTDAIIEELRMGREEPKEPKKVGRPKKQVKETPLSTINTEQQ